MATGTITVDTSSTHLHVDGFRANESITIDIRYHHGGVDANYMGVSAHGKTNTTGSYTATIPLGSVTVEQVTGEALDYTDADIHESRIDAVSVSTQ